MTNSRTIQIINVPLDLGASRRGTDAGPSGFRIAGLHAAIEQLGCEVLADVDIPAPWDLYPVSHITSINSNTGHRHPGSRRHQPCITPNN